MYMFCCIKDEGAACPEHKYIMYMYIYMYMYMYMHY